MKPLFPPSVVGYKTYLQIWLEYLIFGYLFRRERVIEECEVCKKPLKKRRFEIISTRIDLSYKSEFDKIVCIDCAIQTLYTYRRRLKK